MLFPNKNRTQFIETSNISSLYIGDAYGHPHQSNKNAKVWYIYAYMIGSGESSGVRMTDEAETYEIAKEQLKELCDIINNQPVRVSASIPYVVSIQEAE